MPAMTLVTGDLADSAADQVAVPMRAGDDGAVLDSAAAAIGASYNIHIRDYLARAGGNGEVKGQPGEIVAIPVPRGPDGPAALLVFGSGDGTPAALRKAGAALARRAKGHDTLAVAAPDGVDGDCLQAFTEGLALASYTFSRRSQPPKSKPVTDVRVYAPTEPGRGSFARALTVIRAVWLARDLANTPSNEKDPAWLAEQAKEVAEAGRLDWHVWDQEALAAEGFNGILAVGSGSARPPRLISLEYRPDPAADQPGEPHIVIAGKGITFDTGGLSIKPREAMVPMKADMAGGAAVIAVLGALRDLGVRARVTGLVAAAENMPSGSAYRPSDVITQYGGTTVEVLNTDAEGRLVLADALAYTDSELHPDVVVDVATLTGAASLGLSRRVAALYATDDALAHELVNAGALGGEVIWRMPLVEDYRAALDSDIADISHVPRDTSVGGGSITAALFLREFVGSRRWAHLDIAGPGKIEADEYENTKGGTGFGVRTLLRWLESTRPLTR